MRFKLTFIFFLGSLLGIAQEQTVFQGQVIDVNPRQPLPYTNIVVQKNNEGAICNEEGFFSLDNSDLRINDTLVFSYVGYETYKLAYNPLDTFKLIYLEETLFNINEIFVFSNSPDAEEVVKKILENKDKNYKSVCQKSRAFIRQRLENHLKHFTIDLKKNSFPDVDPKLFKEVERSIPKELISYTDFLGDLYFSNLKDDSLKIKPIKVIRLQEDIVISTSSDIDKEFLKAFKVTSDKEFWRLKSGLLGMRLPVPIASNEVVDSTGVQDVSRDIPNTYERANEIETYFEFPLMDDLEKWEFLHQTSFYQYSIERGTRINGEDVYIIDFVPKKRGKYEGRLYVSMSNYALIRADFKYALGKQGLGFKMFGVGYRKMQMMGSVLFEKRDSTYLLKYFSYGDKTNLIFERPLSIVKKRERWLINKKIGELKVKLNVVSEYYNSVEVFILNNELISHREWASFMPKKEYDIQYVNEFSDENWKGYSIIEPTKEMRLYKKQNK